MPFPWFDDPFGGKGVLLVDKPDKQVWVCETSPGRFEQCIQTLCDPAIEANKRLYNESEGKRWGNGQTVASIPLPIYFDKIVPARQQGDEKYIKRFLNDLDNRAFRTFKGKV